jgi:hypothetical protein
MSDHTLAQLVANGDALQLYLRVPFVQDSAFPSVEAGDACLVHPTGTGGLLIQPVDDLQYPVHIDGPPDQLDLVAAADRAGVDLPPGAEVAVDDDATKADSHRSLTDD